MKIVVRSAEGKRRPSLEPIQFDMCAINRQAPLFPIKREQGLCSHPLLLLLCNDADAVRTAICKERPAWRANIATTCGTDPFGGNAYMIVLADQPCNEYRVTPTCTSCSTDVTWKG